MSNEMDILHHIYWFDGEELPSEQSVDACKEIAKLFSEFGKHMVRSYAMMNIPYVLRITN